MSTPSSVETHDKLRKLFARLMDPNDDQEFLEVVTSMRAAILLGAQAFDAMATIINERGFADPNDLKDGLASMKMLGAMLMCFGEGTSRSLDLSVSN